jgi:hypothetical protein
MKRQPSLHHCCPCRGRCHCDCHPRLCRCCRLCCRRRCCCHHHRCCRRPLPSPLPSAIAVAVAVNYRHRHLCCVAVSHCRCCCPRHWPLPSPSPLAIAVAISVGHHHCHRHWPFPRVVALVQQELYSNNLSKECLPYLFFLDSGRRIDQSRMADQVSSGNGHHQCWAASGNQRAASKGSGW